MVSNEEQQEHEVTFANKAMYKIFLTNDIKELMQMKVLHTHYSPAQIVRNNLNHLEMEPQQAFSHQILSLKDCLEKAEDKTKIETL